MKYPDAPWTLKGYALQTFSLIEVEKASQFIPPELEIVTILPSKTLGGIYLSIYQSGSILEYSELIVVPAFVRYQNKTASWVSHIYVDDEKSVAGGREIWGLPKEMADFTWENNQVTVTQNEQQLCHFSYQKGFLNFSSWWRQKFSGEMFSGLDSELLLFKGKFQAKLGLIQSKLNIPSVSPFASLNLNKPLITLNLQQL